jgi:PAS domain S-box-containing protein
VSWLPSTADGRGAPSRDRRLNDVEGPRSAPDEDWLNASAAMSVCGPVEHGATYPNAGPQSQSCERAGRVSEQRHAPRPRRVDGRILLEALDLAGTLIALLDSAGRIVSLNRACEHACGFSLEEVCGRVFWSCAFAVPDEAQAIRRAVREVAVERSCSRVEWQMRHRDGTVRVISWAGRSLSGPDGKPEHILLAGADVTALRHGEEQICNRLAELADLHRIHVVEGLGSVIAHDLNQPLASVLLLAESALRQVRSSGCAGAEVIKDLETIVTQVHRAGAMTKGLRRFLAGASESNAPIDMERTIRGTCELLAPEARAHGIELVLHIAPALPAVRGDASRLEHVLVILIRNGIEAICASGKTQRRIEISALPRDDMVCVTVMDSGPGVSTSAVERIFEPFYSTKSEGLGLGLAISRALAQQLGGRLWAEARTGEGVFHLSLPMMS